MPLTDQPRSPQLYVITGAPGAGKSTLRSQAAGHAFAVVDFDELPDQDGTLLGIDITSSPAGAVWPHYNRLWARVVSLLLRAGSPVLLLCPLTPAEWAEAAAGVEGLTEPVWARLDCADADRTARLTARGWALRDIEEAHADAAELRTLLPLEFSTSGRSPEETATAVAAWITR
ncbi:hypothetical protein ACFWXK_10855 [Streptomyces sp. NPDC059070]|uniref:hypothetical protein n=1 Tax=unclassified Streptomyces TaxID=2593676 RepID=UPI0034E260CD